MDPDKMKVVDLRSELGTLGLDTKGTKVALVERLKKALEAKSGQALPDTSILDTSTEDAEETATPRRAGPAARTRRRSSSTRIASTPAKAPRLEEPPEPIQEEKKESSPEPERDPSPEPAAERVPEPVEIQEAVQVPEAPEAAPVSDAYEPDMPTDDQDDDDDQSNTTADPAAAAVDMSHRHSVSIDNDGADPSGAVDPLSAVEPDVCLDESAEWREWMPTEDADRTPIEDRDWTQDCEVVYDCDGVQDHEVMNEWEVVQNVEIVLGDEDDKGLGAAQGRGRTRARVSGRDGRAGRGATARRSRPGDSEWRTGDSLVEVYPTDEDVPLKLREWLKSLECVRDARQRVARQKLMRRQLESRNDDDEYEGLPAYQDFIRFCQDDKATKFEWEPMGDFSGEKETFLVEISGPTQHCDSGYQAFRKYWTDDFLECIASETNRYASSIPQTEKFHANWYPTNAHEILLFFAFWIMLGIIQMPTLKSCFSLNPILKTDVFRKLLPENRYWALNRALHFANVKEGDSDQLALLRPVIEHLNKKFQELYVPGQNICIDESLTLWKGLLKFRQYIKTKASKYGIKTYELCESATGYLWAFFVYTGKHDDEHSSVQKSTMHVLKLVSPLLGKGYTLFMDNYFNSPLLARFLKRNRTDCVGTLRKSRSDVPPLISAGRVKTGSYLARRADDVVVVNFGDKKPVRLISTYHNMDQSVTAAKPGRPAQYKLNLVRDYNSGMGGVDQKDGMLQANLVERKQCLSWYKKMFKRLLNVSVLNSRILVAQSNHVLVNNNDFRVQLVADIMRHHHHLRPQPDLRGERTCRSLDPARYICVPSRFHAIVKYTKNIEDGPDAPRTEAGKSINRRYCVYCRPARHRTVYECNICKVPLCIEPCFAQYHTEH